MYRANNGGAKANAHSPSTTVTSSGQTGTRRAFQITVTAAPETDAILGLRALLKRLGRDLGMRCTRIAEVPITAVSSTAW